MIFNEVYGAYTRTIGLLINDAIKKSELSVTDFSRIIEANAFSESLDFIRELLNPSDDTPPFPLINKDSSTRKYTTILSKQYKRPITIYELRWLKTISLDPRLRLFCDNFPLLEEIEPLFNPDDIIYYDQNFLGDDFEDPVYVEAFRAILKAINDRQEVQITKKNNASFVATPLKLEYSQKDNRFRLMTSPREEKGNNWYVNLSSIKEVQIADKDFTPLIEQGERDTTKAVLEITDERDAMERICLSFSHLERTSERIDKSHYRLTITYDQSDDAEMIVRIMSFGKYVKVLEPEKIRKDIELRLKSQLKILS